MNIEKIAVNGHYVLVNKDVEIKEGDMCVNIAHSVVVKPTDLEWANSNSDNLKVIIAASPELNLEDVPTYVEWLANKTLYEKYPYHPPQDSGYWKDMFKEGYQTRDEELLGDDMCHHECPSCNIRCNCSTQPCSCCNEPQPTWEDVRKVIEIARDIDYNGNNDYSYTEEEIIEQLKQSKI